MPSILNATTTNGLVTSADNSGSLQLQTNNGTTAVTIDTSQNVGIGVTSPAAKLDVASDIIGRATTLRFKDSGNTTQYGAIYGDSTAFNINSGVNNLIMYSAGTERMRIDSSGNLLVNTTTTNSAFKGFRMFSEAAGSYSGIGATGTSGYDFFNFYRGTDGSMSRVGFISTTGSATTYSTSSDYRLKENIAPMTGALAKVAQLKPVTYTWKSDGSTGQGFIAHELQAVVPDAVTGEKDAVDAEGKPKYQGVDTSFLVATLTAAIQELKAELDATKAEVQALKGVA